MKVASVSPQKAVDKVQLKLQLDSLMKTISMLQFRRHASRILDGLQSAKQTIRLTYRGKPVADLVPVKAPKAHRPPEDDPFYHLSTYAERTGGDLSNKEIDRILYGEA